MEQQKYLGILQLAAQLAPTIVQLMQFAEQGRGSATGASALGAAEGILELFRRYLEQNDIRNIDQVLPEEGLKVLLQNTPPEAAAMVPLPGQAGPQKAGGA